MVTPRAQSDSRRCGITIVEVLVVLGILGLLAALLAPAVQQARQSARRTMCQNHLRQIGVALASAAESTGAFPTSDKPHSPYWRLMPYLDASGVADALMAGRAPDSWAVPVFVCPADPVAHANSIVSGEVSYYFNEGTRFRMHLPSNGFRKSSKADTKPADVSDGLSHTVALSERLVRPIWAMPSVTAMENEPNRYFWWTERRYGLRGEERQAAGQCRSNRTTVFPQFFGVNAVNYYMSQGYDHILPPNHPACYNGPEDFGVEIDLFLIPASSLHQGGVYALAGDGGVHFVSDAIDSRVWQALGTRNGGESAASFVGP